MTTAFQFRFRWFGTPVLIGLICLGTERGHAAVLGTSGSVTVDVQEFLDGVPASFSSDEVTFPEGAAELPIDARALVESTDLDGMLVAIGQGFAELADPARLDQPNPEELALEVACYSNGDDVAYRVTGSSTESRTVVFTSQGSAVAPSEIEFRRNGTREIESRVFLSGAMIVWTPDLDTDDDGFPNGSLDDLSAHLQLTVTRTAPDDRQGDAEELFSTSFGIMGGAEAPEDPSVFGPIVYQALTLEELIADGLDERTAAVLADISEGGSLTMIAFPSQEHAYRYVVRADEAFVLSAELAVDIRNVPGGSGIAVAMGRPFSELVDFIENALEDVDGAAVERALNAAVAKRDVGLVAAGESANGRAMCGALGIEVIPMLGFLGLMSGISRARSRRAR